jgi:hypothetical protein
MNNRKNIRLFTLIIGVTVIFSIAGCASTIMVDITPPFMITEKSDNEKAHIEVVLKEIETRNRTVEADSQWIRESYLNLQIKNLDDIDEEDYPKYREYLDGRSLYIIVHPAYYTFFQGGGGQNKDVSMNAVERFLREPSYSSRMQLIKLQEKMLRDFIEYMSTDKKLVILVLPKDYSSFKAYQYRDGKDEYMRYINEVTNASDSVIYLYSDHPYKGDLSEGDRKKIVKFLYAVRPDSVLIGGGYIGRCLEEFYANMQQSYGLNKFYIVPEITAISPNDLTDGMASAMINSDGIINIDKLTQVIKRNLIGSQERSPKLKNLSGAFYN